MHLARPCPALPPSPPAPPSPRPAPPLAAKRFSVIPRAAVGKVSVRFVPNQDAPHLVDCITAHLQHEFAKLRSGNELSVKVRVGGCSGGCVMRPDLVGVLLGMGWVGAWGDGWVGGCKWTAGQMCGYW